LSVLVAMVVNLQPAAQAASVVADLVDVQVQVVTQVLRERPLATAEPRQVLPVDQDALAVVVVFQDYLTQPQSIKAQLYSLQLVVVAALTTLVKVERLGALQVQQVAKLLQA